MEPLIHELHGSVMTAFRSCRLNYNWHYVDGYSPLVKPAPLEFGSAYHAGMEALYDPETWTLPLPELYALAKKAFIARCEAQRADYLRKVDQYVLDPDDQVDYDSRIALGVRMLHTVARTMDRKKYRPVLVEKEALVPIGDLRCHCLTCWNKFITANPGRDHPVFKANWTGLPVVYGVRADAIVQDLQGRFLIVDWKTTSQLLRDPLILELDGQITTYMWALAFKLQLDICGFMWVQILKDFPKRPRLLKYEQDGRSYSVAKNQRTDYATYLRAIRRLDPAAFEAGYYNEYLEWLKAHEALFIKWHGPIYRSDYQLKQAEQDLILQASEMPGAAIYRAPEQWRCQRCFFKEPCLERFSGGDFQYLLDTEYEKLEPYYIIERERRRADA